MLRLRLRNFTCRRGAKSLAKNNNRNDNYMDSILVDQAHRIASEMILRKPIPQDQLNDFNNKVGNLTVDERSNIHRIMEETMIETIYDRLMSVAPSNPLKAPVDPTTREVALLMFKIAGIRMKLSEADFSEKPSLSIQLLSSRLKLLKTIAVSEFDYTLAMFYFLCFFYGFAIIVLTYRVHYAIEDYGYIVSRIAETVGTCARSQYSKERWMGRTLSRMEQSFSDTVDYQCYERAVETSYGPVMNAYYGDNDTVLHPYDDHNLYALMKAEADMGSELTDYFKIMQLPLFSPYQRELDFPDADLDGDISNLPHSTSRTILKQI